ncbi:hypothetical protein ACHHYP_09818 [Achlya hypogyna]|uniref:Transmembrane protein n=1 Tax=Achlya hypogyna TaxID=1202772 RepID=A0A1V9YMB2_ACHHY|nr:hypothetical protein ACHHYP_09818 [Achlya hypogyna]
MHKVFIPMSLLASVPLSKTAQRWFGLGYLALSMGCSIWFLDIVSPGLSNDLFWPGFEPTTAHTYLLDVFSAHLAVTGSAEIDLFGTSEAMLKTYGQPTTTAYSKTTYPRTLALIQYTTVKDAVVGFRSLSAGYVFDLMTLYCWADFDKRWQVAHTAARQARCGRDFATNGAVYFESYLRNVHWNDWYAAYGASFASAVTDAIVVTKDGAEWYASLRDAFTTVDTEVAYWTSKNITLFQLQWSNELQIGIQESLTITNMFGWQQPLTVTAIPFGSRSSMWSSFVLNWVFYDDLWGAAVANASLVRSAPNFMGDSTMEMLLMLYPFTPCSIIIHDHLGPFQSVDMFLIPPPPSLISAVTTLQANFKMALQSDGALLSSYQDLFPVVLDPVPLHWQSTNYTFFGGNPMCAFGAGASFVQPSFTFDATCGTQVPSYLLVEPMPATFASMALGLIDTAADSACLSCGVATSGACLALTQSAFTIVTNLLKNATMRQLLTPTFAGAARDVQRMNVELIQFALTLGGNSTVLRQPLLDTTKLTWDFFGYVTLYEWVVGLREVVSFQGDVATFTLMSERVEPIPFKASIKEVPVSTCRYLWTIVVLITCTLVTVAIVTASYALGKSAEGLKLLQFNRVVGPVWVGRPLLILRAVTAITALSTTPLKFSNASGVARLKFAPRPLIQTAVLCGEATWLTYVVNDILLVVASRQSPWAAPISSSVVWAVLVVLESVAPIRASATVNRYCDRINMDAQMTCASGTVVIGSRDRALLIFGINFAVILLVYGITCVSRARNLVVSLVSPVPHLISAGAEVFLAPKGDIWSMDATTAAMSGCLRFCWGSRLYIFDSKLWILFHNTAGGPVLPATSKASGAKTLVGSNYNLQSIVKLGVGLTYLAMTAVGSHSYIQLSTVNLANDFWWATFNTTGTQTFVSNWFNRYLLIDSKLPSLQLDSTAYADMKEYSGSSTLVVYARPYTRHVQHDSGADLALMIDGLRSMDGCQAPWIATSYCWLDFQRQLEMANTAARQGRCIANYKANGAVYLESVLRNIDWPSFTECWGASFDVAIATDVPSLMTNGGNWLLSLSTNTLSVPAEVLHWQGHGISTYTTQWQNYKTLGLHDVFSVENAFGTQYDLTLRSLNGSFRVTTSTSWKMYWTFASDLWAVATNGTGMSGLSLIRQSDHFAFRNQSLEMVLSRNGTVPAPLSAVFAEFHSAMGPFGSVDLYHVPTPQTLRLLQRDVLENLGSVLANGINNGSYPAQEHLSSLVLMSSMSPVPAALHRDVYLCSAGNLFCPEMASPFNFSLGLSQFTGIDATCYTAFNEWVYISPQAIFAVIAAGVALAPSTQVPMACGAEVIAPDGCLASIASVVGFVTTFFSKTDLIMYRQRALAVEAEIRDKNIGIMQFARYVPTNTIQLFFQTLFDPADATMMYTSWAFTYDWTVGTREVISAAGDNTSIAVVSTSSFFATFAASAFEMPLNVATYFRVLCQYISFVLVAIAATTGLYAIAGRWTAEGFNLFEVNRVGGMVWIGRPLLFLRSVTALCILSTATLHLTTAGTTTVLVTSRGDVTWLTALLKQVLAAGELGWIVYIYDDFCMVLTRQYAASYTIKTAFSVWIIAAVLSITNPVTHSATIQRRCTVMAMDYEMACHSGVVVIGSVQRLLLLVAIALGTSSFWLVHDRIRYSIPPHDERESYLISCGAKYLFEKKGWVYNRVYYLDYASAVLTGLLVVPFKNDIYVFDVKTWRTVLIAQNAVDVVAQNRAESRRLAYTLPLVQ